MDTAHDYLRTDASIQQSVSLQLLDFIVCQKTMIVFVFRKADQFGFFEVYYLSSFYWDLRCDAPFFVSFQVNQQHCFTVTVPYNNLLRTDNISSHVPQIFTFHRSHKQGLSGGVSVEKDHTSLSTITIALLSLLHQEYESVVESFESIMNICVINPLLN